MSARRFWPGFKWRILAHKRANIGRITIDDYRGQVAMHSSDFDEPVEFDELVIDHWFHLEQMNDRDYWIGLGTHEDGRGYEYMINVRIRGDRRATVSIERE
jgi:hypothetical protein